MNFLIIILTCLSCQQETFKELEREKFSMSYPSYLNLDESGDGGTLFILKVKQSGNEDNFVDNINLIEGRIGTLNFEKIASKSIEDIKNIANIVENKKTKQNGVDCLRVVFETTEKNLHLTVIQHILVKNKKVYVLTFTCETKDFKGYSKDIDKSLLSFKLK